MVLAQRHQGCLGAGDVQVEGGRQCIDKNQHANGCFGGVVYAGNAQSQQWPGNGGCHQLTAEQHAQDDGGNGQALNPAIGLDQLGRGQQLRQNAVLGGGVGRRAQAHHGVGQQRVVAKEHEQTAHDLDGIADEHDAPLGQRVRKRTHKRRKQHVKQREHGNQSGTLPIWGTAGA